MRLRLVVATLTCAAACNAFGSTSSSDDRQQNAADAGDAGVVGTDAAGLRPLGQAADLAVGQQTPRSLVVDAASVYWINEASAGNRGSVMKASKSGADLLVLVPDVPGPYELVADATRVYFTANDDGVGFSFLNLWRHDNEGDAGAETKNITSNGTIYGCVLENGDLFWTGSDLSSKASIGFVDTSTATWGGQPVVPIGGTFPVLTALAADPEYVYAAAVGKILKIAKADGSAVDFAPTVGAAKVIRFDPATANVYWTDATAVRSLRASTPGAPPVDVAPDPAGPSALAIDATNVYWSNESGAVLSIAKAGGATQTISTSEVEPRAIAVDDSGVYWANHGDGRIRVARR